MKRRPTARLEVSSIEPDSTRPREVALGDGGYLTDRQISRIIRRGYGLGLTMPPGENSLDFIEPLKDHLTYLVVTDWDCRDLRVLSEFTKLTYLDIQRTQPMYDVDFSGLTSLREYAGPGSAHCRSALNIFSLETIYLDKSSDEDLEAITGSILELRLERAARNTKVPRTESFASLRQLWVTDGQLFDVSTLAGLADLEMVRLWDCIRISGISDLATCRSLRELSVDGADDVEEWQSTLTFDVDEVSLTNVNSLPNDASALIPEHRPRWTFSNKD